MGQSPSIFLLVSMGCLLINSLISGGILRIAVQLHNRFAIDMRYGGAIEELPFSMATGMMLATNFVLFVLSALIQVYLQFSGISFDLIARAGSTALMLCLNFLVVTWIVALVLNAPWIRALVVSGIHSCFTLIIAMTVIGTFAFVAFDL